MYNAAAHDMALGRYDEAIAACEKSASLYDWWLPHFYLVAAYTHKGDSRQGRGGKGKAAETAARYFDRGLQGAQAIERPAFWQQTEEHVFADLRKAGIPEK